MSKKIKKKIQENNTIFSFAKAAEMKNYDMFRDKESKEIFFWHAE